MAFTTTEHIDVGYKDDATGICHNVRELMVDIPCKNLSHCFPNIHTLTVPFEASLSHHDCAQFRRLRHLITTNINMLPSRARHIHTLTLCKTNGL
jgi:hypothetical protein